MTAMTQGFRKVARGLGQTGTSVDLRYTGLGVVAQNSYNPYGWLLSGTTSGAVQYQFLGLAQVNPADSGFVLGNPVIAAHSPTGANTGSDFTARATMPGLFSAPFAAPWSMNPTILETPSGLSGSNLLALPASSGGPILNSTSTPNAQSVGGYYIDITKGWR